MADMHSSKKHGIVRLKGRLGKLLPKIKTCTNRRHQAVENNIFLILYFSSNGILKKIII